MSTQELIAAALRVADAFDAKTVPEAWMQQELREACARAMVQSDVSEAERLIDNVATSAFASALGEMPSTKYKEARAALLAHIQRGAVLDKPARVGNEIFGAGLSTRYVVEAAQRLHEAEEERGPKTLEKIHEKERIRRKTWEMFNGPLAAAPAPDHSGDATSMICSAPSPAEVPMSQAATDVLAERRRQFHAKGWTPEHDDEHDDGSLAAAAACYALGDQAGEIPAVWPRSWDESWWRPSASKRRNLVKAAALLLAEIERLDRAALREEVKP